MFFNSRIWEAFSKKKSTKFSAIKTILNFDSLSDAFQFKNKFSKARGLLLLKIAQSVSSMIYVLNFLAWIKAKFRITCFIYILRRQSQRIKQDSLLTLFYLIKRLKLLAKKLPKISSLTLLMVSIWVLFNKKWHLDIIIMIYNDMQSYKL